MDKDKLIEVLTKCEKIEGEGSAADELGVAPSTIYRRADGDIEVAAALLAMRMRPMVAKHGIAVFTHAVHLATVASQGGGNE